MEISKKKLKTNEHGNNEQKSNYVKRRNPHEDKNFLYIAKWDTEQGLDMFLIHDMPTILRHGKQQLPDVSNHFLNDLFCDEFYGEQSAVVRNAIVGRMHELHAVTGAEGCLSRKLQPKISTNYSGISGFDIIEHLNIFEALKFVLSEDTKLKSAMSKSTQTRSKGRGYESMRPDEGIKVLYYITGGKEKQLVLETWGENHGCIHTPMEKNPEIPQVFYNIAKQFVPLYGSSFESHYFLGQVQVTKFECTMKCHADHNKYTGNLLKAHVDPFREGEFIISVLLAEPICIRLYDNSKIACEQDLIGGTAYCLRCPDEITYGDSRKCSNNACPRHVLRHEIECAHHPDCLGSHPKESITSKFQRRRGPRFSAIFRFFKKPG